MKERYSIPYPHYHFFCVFHRTLLVVPIHSISKKSCVQEIYTNEAHHSEEKMRRAVMNLYTNPRCYIKEEDQYYQQKRDLFIYTLFSNRIHRNCFHLQHQEKKQIFFWGRIKGQTFAIYLYLEESYMYSFSRRRTAWQLQPRQQTTNVAVEWFHFKMTFQSGLFSFFFCFLL